MPAWQAAHLRTAAIRKRAIYVRAFALWCLGRDSLAPRFVTRAVLESFQRHLFNHRQTNGKPLAWSSQLLHLKELRQFFSWLAKQNILIHYRRLSPKNLPISSLRRQQARGSQLYCAITMDSTVAFAESTEHYVKTSPRAHGQERSYTLSPLRCSKLSPHAALCERATQKDTQLGSSSRDPIGYWDGMSLYRYCKGRPSAFIDPMGLRVCGPHVLFYFWTWCVDDDTWRDFEDASLDKYGAFVECVVETNIKTAIVVTGTYAACCTPWYPKSEELLGKGFGPRADKRKFISPLSRLEYEFTQAWNNEKRWFNARGIKWIEAARCKFCVEMWYRNFVFRACNRMVVQFAELARLRCTTRWDPFLRAVNVLCQCMNLRGVATFGNR